MTKYIANRKHLARGSLALYNYILIIQSLFGSQSSGSRVVPHIINTMIKRRRKQKTFIISRSSRPPVLHTRAQLRAPECHSPLSEGDPNVVRIARSMRSESRAAQRAQKRPGCPQQQTSGQAAMSRSQPKTYWLIRSQTKNSFNSFFLHLHRQRLYTPLSMLPLRNSWPDGATTGNGKSVCRKETLIRKKACIIKIAWRKLLADI